MISIIDSGKLVNTDVSPMVPRSCEMVGLSTDTKPTGVSVGNGWSFIEMDTGKVFFYNAEDNEWLEFAGSGGGGGQGGSNVLIVNYDVTTQALDKTWKEIHDAEYAVITGAAGGDKFVIYIAGFHAGGGLYDVNAYSPYYEEGAVGFDWMAFKTNSENGYPVLDSGD